MNNEIRLGIRIDADGKAAGAEVKAVTGETDKLGQATRNASSEAERLNVSLRNQTLQMASARDAIRQNSVAVTETAGSVTKLLDKYDQTGAKLRQLQADFKALDQAASSGKISAQDDSRLDAVYARVRSEIKAAQEAAAGFGATAGSGFARAAEGADRSAFATAGARRELMVIARELVSGDFSRVPGSMMVLAGRTDVSKFAVLGLGGAVGVLTAVAGAFAVSAYQGTEELKAMSAAINMTGNYSGQTADSLLGLARNVSEGSHQTVGATKEMVTALAESGHIGEAVFGSIAQAAVLYSQASGKSLDEVTPKLIKAFEDPARGAAELNNTLHFLSPAELEHIKNLQDMGDVSAAQSALAEELNKKLAAIQPSLGTLETAWESVKKSASSAWDAMMGVGRKNTLGEELEQAKKKLAEMQQSFQEYQQGSRGRLFASTPSEIDRQKSYINGLEERSRKENEASKAASASAAENEKTANTWGMITKSSGAYHKQQIQNQIDIIKGYKAENAEQAKFQADAISVLQKNLDGPALKSGKAQETAYETATKAAQKYIDTLAKETEQTGLDAIQKKMLEASTVALTLKTEKERTAVMAAAASWARKKNDLELSTAAAKKNNQEFDEFFAASEAERLANENGIKGLREKIEAIEEETLVMNLNADQLREHQVLRALEKSGLEATSDEYLKLKKRMEDAYASNDYARAAKSTAEEWKNIWSTVEQTGKSVFIGVLSEGRNSAAGIGKAFKSSVIDLLYQLTARKWMISIGTSLGVPGLANAATGAASSAAGSAGTSFLGSMGSSIAGSSLMQGMISGGGFLGQLSGGVAGAMQGGIINGFTSGMSMIGLEGGFASGLGLMLPGLGVALAGLALLGGDLFKGGGPKVGSSSYQDRYGNIQAGEYNGETFNRTSSGGDPFKVQDMTRALIGDLSGVAKHFGTTLGEEFRFGLQAEFDPEGDAPGTVGYMVNGQTVQRQVDGQDPEAGARELALIAQQGMVAALREIDLSPIVDPLLDGLTDVGSMTEAQVKTTLETIATLSEMSVSSVEKLFGESFDVSKFAALSTGGENTIQTFARLAGEFQATNAVADMLGQDVSTAFGAVGLASAGMRQALIEGAGGLEKFTAQAQGYYNAFFTDAERQARIADAANAELDAVFESLNLSVPTTHEQFRLLVESLDLSSAEGQSAYQTLMDVSDAFVAVHGTAQEVAAAANEATAATQTLTAGIAEMTDSMSRGWETPLSETDARARATIDEVRGWADALSDGISAESFVGQIGVIQAEIDDAAAKLGSGAWMDETTRMYYEYIGLIGQQQIAQLTAQLERYTELEGQYAGHGADLLQLENWYAEQRSLMAGHTDVLALLEASYQAKRLAIINEGNASAEDSMRSVLGAMKDMASRMDAVATLGASITDAINQLDAAQGDYASTLATANQRLIAARDGLAGANGIDDQIKAAGALKNAIMARYNAEMGEIRRIEGLIGSFRSAADGLDESIQAIRADRAGFDAVGDAVSRESAARQALRAATTHEAQLAAADELERAIMGRYDAELAALGKRRDAENEAGRAAVEAANEAGRAAVEAANRLNSALRGVGDHAKSLLLGDLSALDGGARLGEAERQYRDTLALSRSGDVEAVGRLSRVADEYLSQARESSASATDYAGVFASVQRAMSDLGARAGLDQVFEPAVYAENTAKWEAQTLAIQNATIARLQNLHGVMDRIAAGMESSRPDEEALRAGTLTELETLNALTRDWQDDLIYGMNEQAIAYTAFGLTLDEIAANTAGLDDRIAGAITAAFYAARFSEEYIAEAADAAPPAFGFAPTPGRAASDPAARDLEGVIDELRQLRADVRAANAALARNTLDTSRILRRWEGDGLPETRLPA